MEILSALCHPGIRGLPDLPSRFVHSHKSVDQHPSCAPFQLSGDGFRVSDLHTGNVILDHPTGYLCDRGTRFKTAQGMRTCATRLTYDKCSNQFILFI